MWLTNTESHFSSGGGYIISTSLLEVVDCDKETFFLG
jgi:hypothetical protein